MSLYQMKIYKADDPDSLKKQFDDDFAALEVTDLQTEVGYYIEAGKGKLFLKVTYVPAVIP